MKIVLKLPFLNNASFSGIATPVNKRGSNKVKIVSLCEYIVMDNAIINDIMENRIL